MLIETRVKLLILVTVLTCSSCRVSTEGRNPFIELKISPSQRLNRQNIKSEKKLARKSRRLERKMKKKRVTNRPKKRNVYSY